MGHSLLPVVGIVADAMAGVVYIPMPNALDLWGRVEGVLLMASSASLVLSFGLIQESSDIVRWEGKYRAGSQGKVSVGDALTNACI